MENIEELIYNLVTEMLEKGKASFSENGLNIKTKFEDGCLSIQATYESPRTEQLKKDFENFIKNLNDEFFLEIVESFESKEIKKIQEGLDSEDISKIENSIKVFKTRLNEVASKKLEEINNDIEETEIELQKLTDIRDSYLHVIQYEI